MTLVGWIRIALTLALVVACAIPLSIFIAAVYAGERNFLTPVVGPSSAAFIGWRGSSRRASRTGSPTRSR